MKRADYNQNSSWTAAVALGPQIVRIAEELPAHEQTGLMMQLHQAMVDLPAMIALDITRGGEARFGAWLRLTTTLELIDQVYPALDTAGVRTELDTIGTRLDSPDFAKTAMPTLPAVAESAVDVAPVPPVIELPEPTPAPTSVTVTPEESVHVQPDSV